MQPVRVGSITALVLLLSAQQAAADLFISEYIEGSSNNKAIEIYNGTGAAVSLSGYQLKYYFNGNSSPGRTISLSGTVAAGDVHVVAHSSATGAVLAQADQLDGGSWYNGDDAVVLLRNGTVIDAIGQVGFDPGSGWGSGAIFTANKTLRRKAGVTAGDADAYNGFDPALEWDGFDQNTFDGLGSHGGGGGGDGGGGTGGITLIHAIQGSGADSPMAETEVTIAGIVVGDFQDASQMKGFFVQEEDTDADTDPSTSEGIFVYDGGRGIDVNVGDAVEVTGTVKEYSGLTELSNVTVTITSSINALPAATEIVLPLAATDAMERYEGMLVTLPQTLTVTENYNLGRYGQIWLSSGGRLRQPTNVAAPGPDAAAVQAQNDRNRILIDDGSTRQNPDPIPYPGPSLAASNSLRVGDTTTWVTGVVENFRSEYRVHPTTAPSFVPQNPRTRTPDDVGGDIKVASFNVLNYFNGNGLGGGFPTSRGADTAAEFARQRAKIIAALTAMDADVIGLMEIENDGYDTTSAIQDLVNGLNAATPGGSYRFINPGTSKIGTDEIAVGLIYRSLTVAPLGQAAILDSSVDARFDDSKNRPALAQTFRVLEGNNGRFTGGRFTVAVNHLKSKGSACDTIGDPDTGDGQGNCNITRANAAAALVDWLATDPTGSGDPDFLIIGDLNSYAKEDPVAVITGSGYTDLIDAHLGADNAYSYVFDGQAGYLDHALASASLAAQTSGVTEWHINPDEPRVLDYNVEFKSPGQVSSLYSADPYRASDHDPVIIGLTLHRDLPPPATTHEAPGARTDHP